MEHKARTLLISGVSRGVGRYLAEALAAKGHRIVGLGLTGADQLGESVRNAAADYYRVDLADWASVDRVADQIQAKHKRIDVLINNAAVRSFKDFTDFEDLEIERFIHVNYATPVRLVRKFLPLMKQHGYGRIISISSRAGFQGYRTGSLYCSTKGALIRFTEALGQDLKAGGADITANAICPDSISTSAGAPLSEGDLVLARVGRVVDELMATRINGEIIPVLLRRGNWPELKRRIRENAAFLKKAFLAGR